MSEKLIAFRVTAEQAEAIKNAAWNNRQTVSEFMRRCVLNEGKINTGRLPRQEKNGKINVN